MVIEIFDLTFKKKVTIIDIVKKNLLLIAILLMVSGCWRLTATDMIRSSDRKCYVIVKDQRDQPYIYEVGCPESVEFVIHK